MNEHEWEEIYRSPYTSLGKMKIEGGWIYHNATRNPADNACSESMCFVPDSPNLDSVIKLNEDLRKFNDAQKPRPFVFPVCIHGKISDCIECYEVTT